MDLFARFNEFFTIYFVFPSIILLGCYLTLRLKCLQLTKLKLGFMHLFKKQEKAEEGDISHFQAVATVLASNFGTGNISGMAVALAMGGPGALVWMWVMTFFGAAIQFANVLLGVKYRRKNSNGEYVGGPMYYLTDGLGLKPIAMVFSVSVILAAFVCGNFAQVNSMALPLASMGISPWIVGCVIAFLVGIVVLGGAKNVAKVSSGVVPVMALLYFGTALVILALHAQQIMPAFGTIFRAAFGGTAVVGGVAGFSVMKALTCGFDRALFATDAGTGVAPLLQSGAKTKDPVIDGLVSLTAPFLVMIVCTATALVLIVTGVYTNAGLQSTNMITHAFSGSIGASASTIVVLSSLILFGYTTTLAWTTCLERAVNFLFGRRFVRPFLILYIALVPVGAILNVQMVWILADIALGSMMVINLIGVAGLSREVVDDTQEFFYTKKIKELGA